MSLDAESRSMMLESADRLLTDLCTPELVNRAEKGEWPEQLWSAIEDAGLTLIAVPEEAGGVGGSLVDLCAVLRLLGAHAVPAPAAETALARHVGALAGLDLPQGPLSVGFSATPLQLAADARRVSGDVAAAPWAANTRGIVAIGRAASGEGRAVLIDPKAVASTANNSAGEPRGRFRNSDLPVSASVPTTLTAADAYALAALMRVQQMAGAAARCLEICLAYSRERKQFGRPIGNFQAVQQLLAELAGQVAAVQSAAESAADLAGTGPLPVAAAKVRASDNAGRICAMAHQVLGAMGFTYEHRLHHFTRRLWAWRDEFGSDTVWATEIGRMVAADGADALWPLLTGYKPD